MGINIKHDEIERTIRQLADRKRISMTSAIGIAVHNELQRIGEIPLTDDMLAQSLARLKQVQNKVREDRIDWSRSEDEILGYGADGVPEQPQA